MMTALDGPKLYNGMIFGLSETFAAVFVSFSSSYNSEGIMPFIFLIDFLSFSTFSGEKIYLTLGINPLIFLTEGLLAGGKIDIAKLLGSEIT